MGRVLLESWDTALLFGSNVMDIKQAQESCVVTASF